MSDLQVAVGLSTAAVSLVAILVALEWERIRGWFRR